MAGSRLFKLLLHFTVVALLLLPLRTLAFTGSAEIETGEFPCHTQSAAVIYAPGSQGGSTGDCCESSEVQHDCTHCFASVAMLDEVIISLKRTAYRQPRAAYQSINSIPHESPFKPPRIS